MPPAKCAELEPYLAVAREDHRSGWRARFAEPKPLDAKAQQRMAHKLTTQPGRHLYALRKQTLEPVFSIIKSVIGFRQSLLRVKEEVGGKWSLVCLDWNLNRMVAMRHKSVQYG